MANTYHERGKLVDGFSPREHPNYRTWAAMKSRCDNPLVKEYHNYGGRGISYCLEWAHFEIFCIDMGLRPSKEHSIDRIDNDNGYSKENCRWGTRQEQAMNRRTFRNNTSGLRGVKQLANGRYTAQVNFKKKRYKHTGSFETAAMAGAARDALFTALNVGADVSDMVDRGVRYDSSTGVRGITRHVDGGYLVRTTVGGVRAYLGYFKYFDDAKKAISDAKK